MQADRNSESHSAPRLSYSLELPDAKDKVTSQENTSSY